MALSFLSERMFERWRSERATLSCVLVSFTCFEVRQILHRDERAHRDNQNQILHLLRVFGTKAAPSYDCFSVLFLQRKESHTNQKERRRDFDQHLARNFASLHKQTQPLQLLIPRCLEIYDAGWGGRRGAAIKPDGIPLITMIRSQVTYQIKILFNYD